MQCRQITFCVENNSLPFFSSPSLTGIKNNSSDKSRPSKKSIATVAALHNWAVGVGGGLVLLSGTAKPISCVKTKHAEELSMRN